MVIALRIIRGIVGLVALLQIVGILPALSWYSAPASVTSGMLVFLAFKVLLLFVFGLLFMWLRRVINGVHLKQYGSRHPVLGPRLWAL